MSLHANLAFIEKKEKRRKLETMGIFPQKMTNHLTDFGLLIRE